MIANVDRPYLSPEAYLQAEEHSAIKHEYHAGEVYAMAGGSTAHGLLITNLVTLLRPGLRGSGCQVFSSDMKVKIASRNRFYYPDLLVTCDRRDQATDHYKSFPKLIIEVLSDSMEGFDRGDKFDDYRELDSLEDYVLVSQKRQRIDRFLRTSTDEWLMTSYTIGSVVKLASIGLDLAMAEIYDEVPIESIDPPNLA